MNQMNINSSEDHVLILLYGVSGSGKTTFAKELVKEIEWESESPAYIVERDSIRKLLRPNMKSWDEWKFTEFMEGEVTRIQHSDIKTLIRYNPKGAFIIVSDTNCTVQSRNKWKKFAEENNIQIIAQRTMTSLEESLERNSEREDFKVGEDVIRKQWENLQRHEEDFTI